MISGDIVPWILNLLANNLIQLSDYTLEYATALLMNLSLRSKGKDVCEKQTTVVHILS